uniref:Nuclear receptor n=1 Tax=Pristionchus pacificus TaxID=54126 RepID=A0A8R1V3G6_PRIPA
MSQPWPSLYPTVPELIAANACEREDCVVKQYLNRPCNPFAETPKRPRLEWSELTNACRGQPIQKGVCPEICSVCGKKAIGYNYNVPSCNGCKSFFRRTVQHNRRFVCEQPEKCKNVDIGKRLRCRSCRFARCIAVGMNVRAVGITKAMKAFEERPSESREASPMDIAIIPAPQPIETMIDRLIEDMLYLETSHQKLRRSQYNPSFPPPQSVEWCLLGPSRMGIDFGEMPVPNPPHRSPMPFVPMEERLRCRIGFHFPCGMSLPPTFKYWITVDLAYTIEWLKTLSFFPTLRECEKFLLARNVTQAVAYLTAAFDSYERTHSDVTIYPDGTMLTQGQHLKESTVEHNKWFGIISRLKAIGMDKREYVLLKAIMACDPYDDGFCAQTREMLRKYREKYAISLMSYVMASRGPDKGPYAYSQMLSLINWQKAAIAKVKNTYFLLSALKIFTSSHTQFLDEVNSF